MKKAIIITLLSLAGVYSISALVIKISTKIIFKRHPEKRLKAAHIDFERFYYEWNGLRLSGTSVGDDTLPLVVLVHGSPGAWSDYLDMLTDTLLEAAVQMVAVDRLGFGESTKGAVTSLAKHADMLASFIREEFPGSKAIWMGHSYGGPVVSCVAMHHPDITAGLILVGASIDPALEKMEWFNELASWKVVQWALPDMLITSNIEILALKNELEDLIHMWESISVPVTMVHGSEDKLVPVENTDFARKMLINSPSLNINILPDEGHFIPWTRHEALREVLLEMLDAN